MRKKLVKSLEYSIYFTFFFIVSLYLTAFFLIPACYGPIDDYMFIETFGKFNLFWGFFFSPELLSIGRFYPLNSMEFNLIALIFPNYVAESPTFFYYFIFLQWTSLLIIIFITLKMIKNRPIYIISAISLLLLTPGFTAAFTRLTIGERNSFFFLLIFWYSSFYLEKKQKKSLYILGSISIIMSSYYKEPIFLMSCFFSFLVLKIRVEKNKYFKFLHITSITSGLVWCAIYAVLMLMFKSEVTYGRTNYSQTIKTIVNMLMTDPIIMVASLVYVIAFFFKKIKVKDSIDISMLTASLYIFLFIILDIYSEHYLLPAYAFFIPGVYRYITDKNMFNNKSITISSLITVFILITFSVPHAFYLGSFNKIGALNYQKMLTNLSNKISQSTSTTEIYIDGISAPSNLEIYSSIEKYLKSKSISEENYSLGFQEKQNTPYNQKIDYALITPFSENPFDESIEKFKEKGCQIIHMEKTPYIPNFSLKYILRHIPAFSIYCKNMNDRRPIYVILECPN